MSYEYRPSGMLTGARRCGTLRIPSHRHRASARARRSPRMWRQSRPASPARVPTTDPTAPTSTTAATMIIAAVKNTRSRKSPPHRDCPPAPDDDRTIVGDVGGGALVCRDAPAASPRRRIRGAGVARLRGSSGRTGLGWTVTVDHLRQEIFYKSCCVNTTRPVYTAEPCGRFRLLRCRRHRAACAASSA